MQAKNVLYAAVGAPVVAARKVGDQVATLRGKVSKEAGTYTEAATKAIDDWAAEGEKIVTRISEGKVVEEISQKVDFDQAKEQVSKLRDQLEDMLATWRSSFRPEREGEASETAPASAAKPATTKPAAKPAAKQTATKKPAAKKPAAKASAARTTKSSSAAKKSPAKSTAAKAKTS
jgi:hypothetical protein